MSYSPLKITAYETGLVQSREEFLLPNDAYPTLENAFVWRERIKRKQGYELLGRLRRILTATSIGNVSAGGAGTVTIDILTQLGVIATEPNAQIALGTSTTPLVITIGAPISQVLTDNGSTNNDGTLTVAPAGPITAASINYATGILTLTFGGGGGLSAVTITGAYYPTLPVMGLRSREINNVNNEELVAFDTKYAYIFINGFQEFIPGTTWTGNDSDFFWSTDWYVGDGNQRIFWVTNFSGTAGDPIRYTNGSAWVDFTPQIDAAGNLLTQAQAMLPFRGRLVMFNTLEGMALGTSTNFRQRIRWSAIGTPFTVPSAVVTPVNVNAWRDDIRGQGGFLDIPTSESIISVGFVRDNLVVYCERSTWQLRYTGRSIAPFQIEKVNSELGAESTFSAVQFDTSLVGIGDKGVVECDSFKSNLIDIKIPDLVFEFKNVNNGTKRVHGIRDFIQRLAYWTYVYTPDEDINGVYPNRRLVYNYENDSWAIFIDSLTTLGTFQPPNSMKWSDFADEGDDGVWSKQNYPWINRPAVAPDIVGGNQQGYVEYLDAQVTNDVSLTITNIVGAGVGVGPTIVTSPNHNLETGQIIEIKNIPIGTPYSTLNGMKFYVYIDPSSNPLNTFQLWVYNPLTLFFDLPQTDAVQTYTGGGEISILDNFRILSKKFNFMEEGQNIQMGFVDVLMDSTSEGAISLNVYYDYNNTSPVNIAPENLIPGSANPPLEDTFFNSIVPTTSPNPNGLESTKFWQRVFCATRAAFLTLEWTLSNAQIVGVEQGNDVQIDAQILWLRKAGRNINVGV